MSKLPDEPSRLTAKMNRERLARAESEAIMEEEAKKAEAIRKNMVRLRELRLAKEALRGAEPAETKTPSPGSKQ